MSAHHHGPDRDPLDTARGFLIGIIIGLGMWLAFIVLALILL